jgi:SAM-dependent methyltransferase
MQSQSNRTSVTIQMKCPECGRLVNVPPEEPCLCGREHLWSRGVLVWQPDKDSFYEGHYTNRVNYSLSQSRSVLGRAKMHFLNYGFHEAVVSRVPRNSRILEIGCAGGSRLFAEWAEMVGVDVSLSSLHAARDLYPIAIRADARAIDFAPGSFDGIATCFFWEHMSVADKDVLLKKFYSWLRPGGHLIQLFDVRSENPLIRWARSKPALYQQCFIDHDGHVGLETATDALRRIEAHGFRRERYHGMNRTPAQHLPVYEWMRPYGSEFPPFRHLANVARGVATRRWPAFAFTGMLQLFDDTVGRAFPIDWSRLLLTIHKR